MLLLTLLQGIKMNTKNSSQRSLCYTSIANNKNQISHNPTYEYY